MSQKITLKNVRLAFPNIWKPVKVGNDATSEPRYSAAFPIAPGSENAKALDAAVAAVAKEQWKEKAGAVVAELRKKGRIAYREEPLTKDGEVYDGFEDMHSLNAGNKARPTIVDRDRSPLTEADGRPYAGCYVNAIIEVWAQDNQYGKRINATLSGLQFFKDGDAFGGGRPARADDFDDLGVDDSGDDMA